MQGIFQALKRAIVSFCFYLLLLMVFRLFFIGWMYDYIGAGAGPSAVWQASFFGFRLSLKTAWVLTAFTGGPALAAAVFSRSLGWRVYRQLTKTALAVLSVLNVARYPYYRQFHTGFNQLLFNAPNEDITALLMSLVREFYLPVRLLGALLLAWLLYRLWRWAVTRELSWLTPEGRFARIAFVAVFLFIGRLSYYGGTLDWESELGWENAGVTNDKLLNEAVLDDLQAVYRGYTLNSRLLACNGLSFTPDEIRYLAAKLVGKPPEGDELDVYLTRTAQGAQIKKPRHIFLIVAESYANWPLLPEYEKLSVANGMKQLIDAADSDYSGTLLPNGGYTVSAMTGVVTGLADANLYLTTMPEAYKEPYPTAAAPQMKRLGYTTSFWYPGPPAWEGVGEFTKAQGFDHFYSSGDIEGTPDSVWGFDDAALFERVLQGISDTPGFNVIMTVSNHAPFSMDLAAAGIDTGAIKKALPPDRQEDETLIRELGHFKYADRELARFIGRVKERYPDSLILVVGDHADRYNIEKQPRDYERCAIPLIITGQGVHKGLLLKDAAGSHIDILPTIIELIAPEGFVYQSLGESLTRSARRGVNYEFWLTHTAMGNANISPLIAHHFDGSPAEIDNTAMQDYINAVRSISWWRAKYGSRIEAREEK